MKRRLLSASYLLLTLVLFYGTQLSIQCRVAGATSGTSVAGSHIDAVNPQCGDADDTAALSAANGEERPIVIRKDQVCSAGSVTISNLVIEDGGQLKPLNGQTITLAGSFEAGRSRVFTNALPGQGTIVFEQNASVTAIYPQWWQTNVKPGTTDMTAAVQAALSSTRGRGRVFLSAGSYLITGTLTLPEFANSYSPLIIDGDGAFSVSLINKAAAGNPTFLINRDTVIIRNIGIWGDARFRNDGIRIYQGHRISIEGCELFSNGNAITLQETHSVFIEKNFGLMSGGSGLQPTGASLGWTFGATDSFVYAKLPQGGFANHIIIRDNINEGYNYQVYTDGTAYSFSWVITGNQFEGSTSGLKIDNLNNFEISGNYLGEGGSGYTVDMNNCRNGRIGPNHIHYAGFDSKVSTVRLNDVLSTTLMGAIPRLYITGASQGLTATGTSIDRLQDETSDHSLTLVNSAISDVGGVPQNVLNWQTGRATWYADSTEITSYPTARTGDRILKRAPTGNDSAGWNCIKSASAGSLTPLRGNGPQPEILSDYAAPAAYDFRITILTGGLTGSATYKVEWKPAGSGSYADLTNSTPTSELAHLVKREKDSGPIASFSLRWPPSRTYVAGDQWTLTQVIPPVWTPIR